MATSCTTRCSPRATSPSPRVSLGAAGAVLRGRFSPASPGSTPPREHSAPCTLNSAPGLEWCDRRLLARIHRYTLNRLRAEIEPVSAADFLRFLCRWQRVDPDQRV